MWGDRGASENRGPTHTHKKKRKEPEMKKAA